jgi:hypothetical protein
VKHFMAALAEALPKLFKLFKQAGGRDGFLVALDMALEVSREEAFAALKRKHGVTPGPDDQE